MLQAQRTASERRRARRNVNQRFLSAMADMGIPSEKAELALCETGNVGVEARPAPPPSSCARSASQTQEVLPCLV